MQMYLFCILNCPAYSPIGYTLLLKAVLQQAQLNGSYSTFSTSPGKACGTAVVNLINASARSADEIDDSRATSLGRTGGEARVGLY